MRIVSAIILLAACVAGADTPISGLKLQSDMNAGGFVITNYGGGTIIAVSNPPAYNVILTYTPTGIVWQAPTNLLLTVTNADFADLLGDPMSNTALAAQFIARSNETTNVQALVTSHTNEALETVHNGWIQTAISNGTNALTQVISAYDNGTNALTQISAHLLESWETVHSGNIKAAYDAGTNALAQVGAAYSAGTNALAQLAAAPWTAVGYYIGNGSAFATAAQGGNADTAYGWGDHAGLYATAAQGGNADTAYGWGDHAGLYASSAQGANADTAYGWGNHAGLYASSAQGSAADTAYGWGDHNGLYWLKTDTAVVYGTGSAGTGGFSLYAATVGDYALGVGYGTAGKESLFLSEGGGSVGTDSIHVGNLGGGKSTGNSSLNVGCGGNAGDNSVVVGNYDSIDFHSMRAGTNSVAVGRQVHVGDNSIGVGSLIWGGHGNVFFGYNIGTATGNAISRCFIYNPDPAFTGYQVQDSIEDGTARLNIRKHILDEGNYYGGAYGLTGFPQTIIIAGGAELNLSLVITNTANLYIADGKLRFIPQSDTNGLYPGEIWNSNNVPVFYVPPAE